MNQCASKNPELPFAIKMRKLWAGKFYLNTDDRNELLLRIQHGVCRTEEEAVAFVDELGEWLE